MVARPLRIGPRALDRDAKSVARHAHDLPETESVPKAVPVSIPITQQEVRTIASSGFPLWESIPTMQLRNRRITLAYGNLSLQLADLIASTSPIKRRDANWCTFATWSSRTIGTCIDKEPEHSLIRMMTKPVPSPLKELLTGASEHLLTRGHGAIYRTLAVGNRLVFLEIGTAVSHFVECFGAPGAVTTFDDYWADMQRFLSELTRLDAAWVATAAPDPTGLRQGMQAYYDAYHERDPKKKAELVLLGNLLLGAYEQTRVDTYLKATLSWSPRTQLNQIVRGAGPGLLSALQRFAYAPLSTAYAIFSTRMFLVIELPTADGTTDARVGKPVPPVVVDGREVNFPMALTHITTPELQAILTRYDLSEGDLTNTASRNWASFSDRMNYITNLFRSHQQDKLLFNHPWTKEEEDALMDGYLPSSDPTVDWDSRAVKRRPGDGAGSPDRKHHKTQRSAK